MASPSALSRLIDQHKIAEQTGDEQGICGGCADLTGADDHSLVAAV